MQEEKDSIDTSFYLKLLLNMINFEKYPFTQLVIEKNVSQAEYNQLLSLLDELGKKYCQQKQEGLLDFTSLLIHFAGMLTEKLSPTETIKALKQEGLFEDLMDEFLHIMEKGAYR